MIRVGLLRSAEMYAVMALFSAVKSQNRVSGLTGGKFNSNQHSIFDRDPRFLLVSRFETNDSRRIDGSL